MHIVILDGYTENPGDLSWGELEKLGDLTVYDRTSLTDEDEIISRIGGAEVVLTNKTPISRRVMDACPSMRFIAMLATGYNVVDIACAKEKGIPVSNVPVYGTHSVSQFAIALLLEICHHIGYHNDTVKSGKWEQCPDWCYWDYPLIELAGKTYGLLGCGNIGIHTAAIASALGMHVIAYDMRQRDEALQLGVEYVSLDELFARSDVLGLQMPLFPFNTGIINRENIAKMKDGVIIINNSRGQMVVEQDLAARVQKEDLIPGRGGEAAGHLPVKEREVHQRGVPQPPLPLQLEGEIDGAVLRHAGADTVPPVQAAPDGKRIAGASRGGEQHPPVLETEKVGDKGLTDKRVVLEQLKELLRLPGEAIGLRIGKVLQPDEVVQLPDKLLQGARNAAVHRTGQSVELAVRLLQQEGVVAAEALYGQGQAANGEEKNQDHQKKNRRPALFLPLHTTHPLVKFRQILYTEIILDFKPAVKGEKHSGGYGADCGRR